MSELDFANAVSLSLALWYLLDHEGGSRRSLNLPMGRVLPLPVFWMRACASPSPGFRCSAIFPSLGRYFRSVSFQKSETELVIIVTPHLVKPVDVAQQPLPTDAFIEPNDVEFCSWGSSKGTTRGEHRENWTVSLDISCRRRDLHAQEVVV